MLLELCSLCPIEPACERGQMLEYVGCKRASATDASPSTNAFAVKGQPYRCWLLAVRDSESATA